MRDGMNNLICNAPPPQTVHDEVKGMRKILDSAEPLGEADDLVKMFGA
jgi:hypothetical protein